MTREESDDFIHRAHRASHMLLHEGASVETVEKECRVRPTKHFWDMVERLGKERALALQDKRLG